MRVLSMNNGIGAWRRWGWEGGKNTHAILTACSLMLNHHLITLLIYIILHSTYTTHTHKLTTLKPRFYFTPHLLHIHIH